MHKFGCSQKCWKKVLTGIRGSLRPQDYWSLQHSALDTHWHLGIKNWHGSALQPTLCSLRARKPSCVGRSLGKKWNVLNFSPWVSFGSGGFSLYIPQMNVSSVSIGLSQKPVLAEPGFELGQTLCTGRTSLARLGPGASDRSIRGLLWLLLVPSLQSSFGGWWKNTEYGFLWMAPLLVTRANIAARSMRFLWGKGRRFGEDKRLILVLVMNHIQNRESHINWAWKQNNVSFTARFTKWAQGTWKEISNKSSEHMAWTRDWLVEWKIYRNFVFFFLMCISKVRTKLWQINIYRCGWSQTKHHLKKAGYIQQSQLKNKYQKKEGIVLLCNSAPCSSKHHMLWGLKVLINIYIRSNQFSTFKWTSFAGTYSINVLIFLILFLSSGFHVWYI